MEASARHGRPVRRKIGTLIFIVAVIGQSSLYAQVPTPSLTASVARESLDHGRRTQSELSRRA